jgi:cell division protein ZapB
MISEFELLAEKVERLAALTNALRLENGVLRRQSAELAVENKDMQHRMEEAHERVATLLSQLPVDNANEDDADEEAA